MSSVKLTKDFIRYFENKYSINIESELSEYTSNHLVNIYRNNRHKYTTASNNTIMSHVEDASKLFNMPVAKIIGMTRKRECATLRYIIMDFIKVKYGFSQKLIGATFSHRNHSTVSNAIGRIQEFKDIQDPLYLSFYNPIKTIFNYDTQEKDMQGM